VVEWRKIPGFPGYEASEEGQIRASNPRYKRGYSPTLRPWIVERHGRQAAWVTLCIEGQRKKALVNRLVTFAFHGLPPEGNNDSCHIDHNSLNNRADNLEWKSHRDNVQANFDREQEIARVAEGELEAIGEEWPDMPF
jgi:hypothetical protein